MRKINNTGTKNVVIRQREAKAMINLEERLILFISGFLNFRSRAAPEVAVQ